MASDKNNFGPRFGFAYRPGFLGEGVVRGGYGIYYTPQISNAIFAMAEGGQATAGASVIGNPPACRTCSSRTRSHSAAGSGVVQLRRQQRPEHDATATSSSGT